MSDFPPMKVLIPTVLSFLWFTHTALGQESDEYIDNIRLQEIITVYLNEQYGALDTFLKNYGYSKAKRDPFKELEGFSSPGSFLYTYDAACDAAQYDCKFFIKYACQNEATKNCDYYIRNVIYSPILHENEEDQLIGFLQKYGYNLVESNRKGEKGPYTWVYTKTPESVKRKGELYLFKAEFFVVDAQALSAPGSFCGIQYRIGYELHFRRGYFSLDSIGYVATNEGSNLRMRDGPSLDSTIIMSIPDKSKVSIIEYADKVDLIDRHSGNWYKVKYADKTGWVWGNYILLESEKRAP